MTRLASGPRSPLRVHVVVLRDCTPLVPIGVAEILRKAAVVARDLPGAPPRPIEVRLVSPAAQLTVTCAGDLKLRCDETTRDVRRSHLVVVPALDPDVLEHLAENRDVVPWLRRMYLAGADIASACTGAFLLAEAGLLDGRSATTHWAFQELFGQRYPRAQVLPQSILVDEGARPSPRAGRPPS